MKNNLSLVIYSTIFLSLCSYLSSLSWVCSLIEHFRHMYLLIGLICLCIFLLKKKYTYAFMCVICISLNASVIFTFIDFLDSSFEIKNFPHSISFHNIHSGNDSKIYSQKLKEAVSSKIIAFFEVNSEMSNALEISLENMNPIFLDPSEDNYGWNIFSSLNISKAKSFKLEDTVFVRSFYVSDWQATFFLIHLPPPIFSDLWEIQTSALRWMSDEIQKTDGKILIAGDFNLTPWSYQYRGFRKKLLKKNIRSVTKLFLPSWPSTLPILPIDHVFSNFDIFVKKISSLGSDHYLHSIHF